MQYRRKAVTNRVDLLLTCDWPERLRGGAPALGQKMMTVGAREVQKLNRRKEIIKQNSIGPMVCVFRARGQSRAENAVLKMQSLRDWAPEGCVG